MEFAAIRTLIRINNCINCRAYNVVSHIIYINLITTLILEREAKAFSYLLHEIIT